MKMIINCECGHVVRGETEDELIANAQRHASEAHGMRLSREQVLSLATPVEA